MTVASILQCSSLSHVAKKNLLSLQERITKTRGVRTRIFSCPHHCVRVQANSKTFQDLKLTFLRLPKTKVIFQDCKFYKKSPFPGGVRTLSKCSGSNWSNPPFYFFFDIRALWRSIRVFARICKKGCWKKNGMCSPQNYQCACISVRKTIFCKARPTVYFISYYDTSVTT